MFQEIEKTGLKSILPMEEMRQCFDLELHFHEYSLADLWKVMEMKPYILSGLAMSVWTGTEQSEHARAYHGWMPEVISWEPPSMHTALATVLSSEIIKDLYYVTAVVNDCLLRDLKVAELLAAVVRPNCLYIAEFDFSMIPKKMPVTNYLFPSQWYLDILHKIIDNAITYAREQGCSHLLMNARKSQYIDCFLKRGFLLHDPKTESHVIRLGVGIPMVRQL